MLQRFQPDSGARVLVVGDVILDRYVHGISERISPEAPVPVVRVSATEERPGGAANVALNIRSLGIAVQLHGITGADESGAIVRGMLRDAGVDCAILADPKVSTITKVRVVCQHQQLLRMDHEQAYTTGGEIARDFEPCLRDCACVVVSDYGKGTLAGVQVIIDAARKAGVPVLVDPKGMDFDRYSGATLLTPNMREFEAIVGKCANDRELEARAVELCRRLSLDALLVTRGEAGMTLVDAAGEGGATRLPARAHEVFDVTGAGDTVIGVIAAALASGFVLRQAVEYANVAAGIVVERLGTAAVTLGELNAALEPAASGSRGVVGTLAALQQNLDHARRRGETIVMTNGCFDILHPGHVEYLEQAKLLGDRLVVAVNADASVARLKGAGRPVNPLASRMRLLAALASVDWVIPFNDDTPLQLIESIRPDVLVKGGDYAPGEIVGGDVVAAGGGRVVVVPFMEGHSTSRLLDRITGRRTP